MHCKKKHKELKKIQSHFIESKYNNYAQKEAAVKVVTF